MNLLVKFGPLAVAAFLAGCAASSAAPVLLTLPPVSALPSSGAVPSAASASAPLLTVRRVGIPEYLVSRRVRFRADAATLAEWPNTYWAERIEIGVSREFVSALRHELPGWSLCDTNCGDQSPGLGLTVNLVPMDYVRSTQQLQARARITLSGAGTPPKVLQVKELSLETASPADTAQGQAQAITTLIERVAAEAAMMVRSTSP